MSSRVIGLGHVGIFVQDLDRMSAFYEDFMGMHPTKTSDYAAFFSSAPARSDHEIMADVWTMAATGPGRDVSRQEALG